MKMGEIGGGGSVLVNQALSVAKHHNNRGVITADDEFDTHLSDRSYIAQSNMPDDMTRGLGVYATTYTKNGILK